MSILIGMVMGVASIFMDQYDIEFDPDGTVKEVLDTVNDFQETINMDACNTGTIDQNFDFGLDILPDTLESIGQLFHDIGLSLT